MNRIDICFGKDAHHAQTDATRGEVYAAKYSIASSHGCASFATFSPLHYEPKYAYPLIVWLHGAGDSEAQLRRVMPSISLRNYASIAPRGGTCAGQQGYSWEQSPNAIERAQQSILDCIAAAEQRFNISAPRIFLAGFGCGGTMAMRVAMSNPERFAAVASLAGGFPHGHTPLFRIDAARDLPVFLAHGRHGVSYDEERVCKDLRLLHAAGISVTLRQYPSADELTTRMLADLDVWLMEIVTGASTTGATAFPAEDSLN
jgi:phospholipase/carboxylesterase